MWKYESGECTRTLLGLCNTATSVTWIKATELIASGSEDKKIKLWNYKNG